MQSKWHLGRNLDTPDLTLMANIFSMTFIITNEKYSE